MLYSQIDAVLRSDNRAVFKSKIFEFWQEKLADYDRSKVHKQRPRLGVLGHIYLHDTHRNNGQTAELGVTFRLILFTPNTGYSLT